MKSIQSRLERLEAQQSGSCRIAFIAYAEDETTRDQAIETWQAENGSINECGHVFFTIYEARP